jgi:hypothetical protein
LPSSLPADEQEDNDDDSDYDDADATETCASDDESLIESLESIDWTTDSEDNELYYLCWDNDEAILVLGEDDNRGFATSGSGSGSDSIGGSGGDSIDAGDTHHSAGSNSTADSGGCCGDGDDNTGIASIYIY